MFFRQKHSNTCGPIAIMNVLKCLGRQVNQKDLEYWVNKLKCTKDGTYLPTFSRQLKKIQPSLKRYRNPSIKIIEDALKKHKIIVFNFFPSKNSKYTHVSLILKAYNDLFFILNLDGKTLLSPILKKDLLKIMNFGNIIIWILKRKKNAKKRPK